MSKETRQKKKKKQIRLPSEYTEGTFHFKRCAKDRGNVGAGIDRFGGECF